MFSVGFLFVTSDLPSEVRVISKTKTSQLLLLLLTQDLKYINKPFYNYKNDDKDMNAWLLLFSINRKLPFKRLMWVVFSNANDWLNSNILIVVFFSAVLSVWCKTVVI